nr:DUF4153 domain-containing protein [Anaeromonas gelatinilytica]
MSLSLYVYFEEKDNIKKLIRIISHLLIAVILVVFYFIFLKEINYISGTRYVALSIALYIIFTVIPYINKKDDYEIYVIKLFSRFIVTYVYSVVLYLGLAAILTTINLLFNAEISFRVFSDIAFIVAGIFAPAFFLADIPKRKEKIAHKDYPKVLRVLLQFIVLPLLLAYTVILYVYFGEIIITMELPQGLIGNLVLWYSILSTIVLLFIYPLRKINKWIKSFLSVFPKVIIPLLGMMFFSIGIRINVYGITENRYFVVIIGIWIVLVMIYYSIKKDIKNITLTTTLAIIAIASVFGPLSSYSISKWSQNQHFKGVLEKYDILDEKGKIEPPSAEEEFEESDQRKVSSIIQYFDRYHDLEDIKYLPEDFKKSDMEDVFGFRLIDEYIGYQGNREFFDYTLDDMGLIIDIGEFDYFSEHRTYDTNYNQNDMENISIIFEDRNIIIKDDKKELYTKNLDEIIKDIIEKNIDDKNLSHDEMSYIDENDDVKIKILFNYISGYENISDSEIMVEDIEFYTFVKIK